jgi:hypothetical protein
MVEEVRSSAAEEEGAIHALFSSMQVKGGVRNLHPAGCAASSARNAVRGVPVTL